MVEDVQESNDGMIEGGGVSVLVHGNVDASKIVNFKRILIKQGGISSEQLAGWEVVRIQTEVCGNQHKTYAYLAKLKK